MRNWLLFAIGFGIGVAGGLYYAWLGNPVEYIDTAPNSLRADFRADYLALIASAYASGGDLVRARARLALFPELDPSTELAELAQQRLATGLAESEASALAGLSNALSQGSVSAAPATTASEPNTPTPSATLRPTRTARPTATPGAAFALLNREQVCDPVLDEPLIQVNVVDAAQGPVSGMEITVVWNAGQDRFFTGLKPELGLGYGDFTMTEGVSYTLQLANSQQPITNLSVHTCESEEGDPYPGSWLLEFEQSS